MNLRKFALRALIAALLVLPVAAEAYKLWSGEYAGEFWDWFRAATFISGGDWIVVGENYRTSSNANENLRMLRIDETGEVVWDRKIIGDSPDQYRRDVLRGVAPSPDGGWVTAGDLQMSAGLGDSDAWVAKWDRYGDLVWSQLIGTEGQEDGFQVVASPAGGYFLYGRTTSGDYGAVVVKLDEDGVIDWAKHFDDVSISIDTSSIAATADGGCVFVAWDPPSVEPEFHRNLVVKLDQFGGVGWMKEIGGTSLSDVTLRSVAPHPDGYVLVGEMYLRPWLVKVNGDGSEASQYRVKMFEPGPPPTGAVQISEIRTWPDAEEYFELSGSPGTSLDDLTYLVIGDSLSFHVRCDPPGGEDPPGCCDPDPFDCWCFEDLYPNGCRLNSGVIEEVVDLSGQTIPDSGFFVAAEAGFGLGPATLTTPLNFEDDDNVTHLLVRDFTGALDVDLDTNPEGTLDATPWAEAVDEIALIEEANEPYGTEWYYSSTTLGPDGIKSPVHAYRGDSGWVIGERDFSFGDDTAGLPNLVGDITSARGWDVIVADDGIIWNGPVGTTNWFLKTDLSDPKTVLWEREFLEPYRDSIATDLVLGPDGTFVGVGKTLGWQSWMVRARVSDGMAAATCTTGTRSAFIEEADFFGWLDSSVVVSDAALQVLDVLDWVAIDIQDINQPDMLYCLEINGEVVILFEGFEDGTTDGWSTVVP